MQALQRIETNRQDFLIPITVYLDAGFLATMDAYIQKHGFQSREHFLHNAVLNQQCDQILMETKLLLESLKSTLKNQQGGQ